MKQPAKFLFAVCLATIVAEMAPGIVAAADNAVAPQDLVQVRASDQVVAAFWSRQSDSYVLQVVLDRAKYAARQQAIYQSNKERIAARMAANPITSITADEMQRLGIVNVAEALAQLVPQNIGNYMPSLVGPSLVGDPRAAGAAPDQDRLDRNAIFIGNTIASLRGLDPSWTPCGRMPTAVDARRGGQQRGSTSVQVDLSDPPKVDPPSVRERRVEVWLLKADGTQILPAAYSCLPDATAVDVSYSFSVADSGQAIAAAVRIDDDYYIQKLRPLALEPETR